MEYVCTGKLFAFDDRFTATGASPAARWIRILPMNQYAMLALLAVKQNAVKRSTQLITYFHAERCRPTCIFIGKFRICYSAGGAPVAVMRRPPETVNKDKNLPIYMANKSYFA
jgi:hypothetical protein